MILGNPGEVVLNDVKLLGKFYKTIFLELGTKMNKQMSLLESKTEKSLALRERQILNLSVSLNIVKRVLSDTVTV